MAHSSNFSSREKYKVDMSEDETFKQQRIDGNINHQTSLKEHTAGSNGVFGQYSGTMMLMVHKNESLDLLNSNPTDDEQDEMLLTRTDPEVAISSNAESTHRSGQGIPGEFEKRITDIKAKLNQIKNSINTELDNKPKADSKIRTSFEG